MPAPRFTLPFALAAVAGLLTLPLLGPGCGSDDGCTAGSARVRVVAPAALFSQGPLTVRAEVVSASQVLGSAQGMLAAPDTLSLDVPLPAPPPDGTNVVAQVFATGAGPMAGVLATGFAEVEVSGGCFAVTINLLGTPDAGVPPDGGAGRDAAQGIPVDANIPDAPASPGADAGVDGPAADGSADAQPADDATVDGQSDA